MLTNYFEIPALNLETNICLVDCFHQVSGIFNSLDNSGDRLIEFDEFTGVMNKLKENGWVREQHSAEDVNEDEIKKIFSIVDRDGSGFLSKREARRACKGMAHLSSLISDFPPPQKKEKKLQYTK